MAKKSFKGAATSSIKIPTQQGQEKKRKVTKGAENEARKVTTYLLKPSIQKRFKIVCIEKDLKVQDEVESMFLKWLEENE